VTDLDAAGRDIADALRIVVVQMRDKSHDKADALGAQIRDAIGLSLDRLRALERYGAYTLEQAIEEARAAAAAGGRWHGRLACCAEAFATAHQWAAPGRRARHRQRTLPTHGT
jgi:hypothetical protein